MMGSGSVKVYKGTESLGTATATNGTVDLLSFLNGKGGIETGVEYHLRYSTTIQPNPDGTFDAVKNKARVIFDNTPKEVEITLNPKIDKTITSGKTVHGNGGEQKTGDITVQKNNGEDYYRLHYKITVKPGTGTSTLKVNDTISAGQEYISGTFYLGFNDDNNTWKSFEITPSISGNSFEFDVAAFLASKGYSVKAQREYQITYDTKITEDQIGESQTNTSEWTWDHGKSGPDGTDVTPGIPEKGYKIDKTATHDGVDVGQDQQHLYVEPGDIVDFTVVVGLDEDGNPKDMAGRRIYDEITNYGTLEGDVTITPAVGSVTTLPGSTLDGSADGTTKKVYDFTFPSDDEYIQPNGYTITYHIKISENSDLSGRKQLLNKAFIDHTPKETKTPIDYGVAATTKKSFSEWNENDKKIYWFIDVEIPEGKSLHNLYVTDYRMQYGTNSDGQGWLADAANLSFDSSDITVSWLDDSITEPVPSYTLKNDAATPNEYTVNTKGIFFTELNHSIRIRVATVSPVEFDSLSAYYAYNKAYVHSDEGEIGKPGAATEKFTATEYRFKKSGTYDQDTNVATWTVEINKGFLEVNPDFMPYFTDKIPDNMELIGNTINVQAYVNNINNPVPQTRDGDGRLVGRDFNIEIVDNTIQPVNIGILEPSWGDGGKFKLSHNYYVITYSTKINDQYLQQIQDADVLTKQTFTNFAELKDEGGNTQKTDDDTVEYKYDNLINKESGNLIYNEYIPYTVTVNPEAKVINGNKPYTVSDVISTDVNLYIGSMGTTRYPYVRDANGNDMLESGEASISYNDDTRELALTVPDGKKVTFVFVVNAIENGKKTFSNTVVLNAEISDEDTTEREYEIKKSEAAIEGLDLYVSLKKIDRNDPFKNLQGAKFKLVHVKTPGIPRKADGKPQSYTEYVDESGETQYHATGDGHFGEEEEIGTYSTKMNGGLNFTEIQPYEVYYWVETEAAPGYIITNTEKHYFVAYPIVRNKPDATTDNQHNTWAIDNTVSEANGVTIVSARSGYSWNVTNLKEETVSGHFEGVKTLQGRDMEKDEFSFSVEAVSANVKKIIDDVEREVTLTPAEMPMPAETTVKNPAGTKDTEVGFAFGNIDFTMPGTYLYKIKESVGTDESINYDQTEYTAEVTITRDAESGELQEPTIKYTKEDGTEVTKPSFVNELKLGSLEVTKNIMTNGVTDSTKTGTFYYAIYKKAYSAEVPQEPVKTGSIIVTEDGTKTETVNDLPYGIYYVYELTGENGDPIISTDEGTRTVIGTTVYTVTGSGTTATVSETNGTATLNNNVETVNAKVKKVWNDNNSNKRPGSITVELVADGVGTGRFVTLTSADNWATKEILNLPKYNSTTSEEIHYTWNEESVSGYLLTDITVDENGVTTLTNTKSDFDLKTSYTGTKNWSDLSNKYNTRTENLTIVLQQSKMDSSGDYGEFTDTTYTYVWVTPIQGDAWTYKFDNIPVYDENGNPYHYKAKETAPGNYELTSTVVDTIYNHGSINEIAHETSCDTTIKEITQSSEIDLAYYMIKLTQNDGYLIWTHRAPTPWEIEQIKQQYSSEYGKKSVQWASGEGTVKAGKSSITFDIDTSDSSTLKLDLSHSSEWSMLWYGNFAGSTYSSGNTTFTNELDTTELSGKKIWTITGENTPEDPILSLTRTVTTIDENNTETISDPEAVIGQDGNALQPEWSGTGKERTFKYNDLPAKDANGNLYTYKVSEYQFTVNGATYTVTKNEDGTFTASSNDPNAPEILVTQENNDISNTEVTDFEVTKIWKDLSNNNVAWVKDIEVILHQKQNSNDKQYKYTVKEETSESGVTIYTATSTDQDAPAAVVAGNETDGYTIKWSQLPIGYVYSATEKRVDGYKDPIYVIKAADVEGGFSNSVNGTVLTDAVDGGYIINRPYDAVTLPESGGFGTTPFYTIGLLLIAFAAGLYTYFNKKKLIAIRSDRRSSGTGRGKSRRRGGDGL